MYKLHTLDSMPILDLKQLVYKLRTLDSMPIIYLKYVVHFVHLTDSIYIGKVSVKLVQR